MFEKVDDHTYAAAMDYDLADYNGDTAAIDCQLTVAGLTGVQNAYVPTAAICAPGWMAAGS